MKVLCYGVRGSIPISGDAFVRYGGETTCFGVQAQNGGMVFVDAGTGLRVAGKNTSGQTIFHILLSHGHLDHLIGLPFFNPLYNAACTVTLHVPFGLENVLEKLMDGIFFPLYPVQLPATIQVVPFMPGDALHIDGIEVQTIAMAHPGGCVGFRMTADKSIVAFSNDCEIADTPRHVLEQLMQDADVLIADGQYAGASYESFRGWGHSCWEDWVHIAVACRVKHLLITHHDPNSNDVELECRNMALKQLAHIHTLKAEFARCGITVPVGARAGGEAGLIL